jgi:hypothetical protein
MEAKRAAESRALKTAGLHSMGMFVIPCWSSTALIPLTLSLKNP